MTNQNLSSPDPTGILDGYTRAENYTPPDIDNRLAERLMRLAVQAADARAPYDRSWDLYRRYLKGESVYIHKFTGEVVQLSEDDSRRLRSSKNALRPTARSLVGKLCRSIPTNRVVPPSNDFEDTHGAQVGDALLQHLRRFLGLDMRYQEACEYLPWAGNGFIELDWDRLAGETKAWCEICDYTAEEEQIGGQCPQCQMQREQELMAQQASHEMLQEQALGQWQMEQQAAMQGFEGMPPMGPDGMPAAPPPEVPQPPIQQMGPLPPDQEPPVLVETKTGDVSATTLDARDLYVEPGATTIAEAGWILTEYVLPVHKVRRMFPEMAHTIQHEAHNDFERNGSLGDSFANPENYDDHVKLRKFQEAPTELYPRGRMIWMANGHILREIEHPIYKELGRFPVFHFGWDKNQGEYWFEPFIQQAWHRQREINNTETAIREHIELLLKPKVLLPLGNRVAVDEFTATSAQVVAYNRAAGEPVKWDPSPVPPDLWNRGPLLEADVRQQAGVTESDIGIMQADPNGRAMAIINAEADQQLGPIVRRNNGEWRMLHRALLAYCQKFYRPDKTWTVAGPDGVEVYHFYEMNLRPGWDIELEEHDGLSTNPAVRLQQVNDLANLGYFIDPQTGMLDKKGFARAAKLHVAERGYNLEATERAAAAAIPSKIKRGEPVVPHTYDDPLIFGEVLLGWLRGPGRREDPMLSMQVEQIWQFYVMWAMSGQMPGNGFPAVSSAPGMGMQQGGPNQTGSGTGSDQSAPGGSANNPGHIGSDQSIQGAADTAVSQADRTGDKLARTQQTREG